MDIEAQLKKKKSNDKTNKNKEMEKIGWLLSENYIKNAIKEGLILFN